MKILVTGSTGFIGGHLCQALVAAGHEVTAFHRATSNLSMLEGLTITHAIGDLNQPDSLLPAFENGIEVVFHCAAHMIASGQSGRMYTITVEGTRAVLRAARQAGVRRFVHTSSVAALGVPEKSGYPGLLNENHTWNYRPDQWTYGYAKYLAELEVQKAIAQGLDAVILSPTYVLGPQDVYRQNSSIIMQTARGKVNFLPTGGINIIHIQDVISGHLAGLENGKPGERYILGGENLSYANLIGLIAQTVNVPTPHLVLPGALVRPLAGLAKLASSFMSTPVDPSLLSLAGYYFYYDNAKAQKSLNWQPTCSTQHAIEESYRWFKK